MISRVLVDLDGVMTDFVGAALKLHRFTPEEVLPHMRGKYDIEKILEIPARDFWRKISEDDLFWHELEKTEEADSLLELVSKRPRSPEQVFFCSSPTSDPASHHGKAMWVKKHYPVYLRRLILCSQKHFLANRDTLLIDDSDNNVDAFKKAGGRAILVPRPWNSLYAFSGNPLKLVRMELQRL